MRTKQLLVMALGLSLALFSCQKIEDPASASDGDGQSVTLKISGAAPTQSRAIQDDISGSLDVTLSDGYIFFYDNAGYVWDKMAINVSDIVGVSGQLFENISPLATKVYIVGNLEQSGDATAISAIKAAQTIDEVTTYLMDRSSQDVAPEDIMLANIIKATHPEHDALITLDATSGDYTAKVLLAPIMSRLQLADIKTTDSRIKSYNFSGVYIDNYYTKFNPTTSAGTGLTLYTVGTDGTELGTEAHTPFDQATTPIADNGGTFSATDFATAESETGDVFAYHLTPMYLGSGQTQNVPYIIIKLTDVVYTDENGDEQTMAEGYITVSKYVDSSGDVVEFEPGSVYNIPSGSFVFDLSNISTVPNMPIVDLTVFAEVCPWTVVNVTPQL